MRQKASKSQPRIIGRTPPIGATATADGSLCRPDEGEGQVEDRPPVAASRFPRYRPVGLGPVSERGLVKASLDQLVVGVGRSVFIKAGLKRGARRRSDDDSHARWLRVTTRLRFRVMVRS
jgi:hypothetical protein